MSLQSRVLNVIGQISQSLQADGGDIEFLGIEGTTVKVRLTGACAGCPMSQMTLTQGVERVIKQMVPEITSVQNVPKKTSGCDDEACGCEGHH